MRTLLEHGADPAVVDEKGRTPLIEAVRGKHSEVATVLLATGKNNHLEAKDKDGLTALSPAARLGYLDLVRLLIAAEAEVDTKRSPAKPEWTPFLRAAWTGNLPLLRVLVEAGAQYECPVKLWEWEHRASPVSGERPC